MMQIHRLHCGHGVIPAGLAVLAGISILAATSFGAMPDPKGPVTYQYGYGPGRTGFALSGWYAHNWAGSLYGGHATDFEDFADFSRMTVGLEHNFVRSFLWNCDVPGTMSNTVVDLPGVTRPGRVVLTSRRLAAGSKIILTAPAGNIRVGFALNERGRVVLDGGEKPIEWGDTAQLDSWHQLILDFDGKTWTFSIDDDPATRMTLRAEKGKTLPLLSLGMGYEEGRYQYYDVKSLSFLPPGIPAPQPPPPPPDGPYVAKYPTGVKWVETGFTNGVEDGLHRSWHPNGQRDCEGGYVRGLREGAWTWWHTNGALRIEARYARGKLNGPWKRWYPSGQLETSMAYQDDAADGPYARFYADGKPQFVGDYRKNLQHGHWVKWLPNGAKRYEFDAVEGAKTGVMQSWDVNSGKLEFSQEYSRGRLNGKSISYFPSGHEKESGSYSNGVKTGRWILRDDTGRVVKED